MVGFSQEPIFWFPPSQREETDCVKLVSKFDEDQSSGSRVTGVQSWSLTLYKAERHSPTCQLVSTPSGGRTCVPARDTRHNIFLEKLGDDLRPTFEKNRKKHFLFFLVFFLCFLELLDRRLNASMERCQGTAMLIWGRVNYN